MNWGKDNNLIKQEFAEKKRKHNVATVVEISMFLVFILGAIIESSFLGILAVLGVIICTLYILFTFTCPACGQNLNRISGPQYCPKCGVELE